MRCDVCGEEIVVGYMSDRDPFIYCEKCFEIDQKIWNDGTDSYWENGDDTGYFWTEWEVDDD